MLARGRKKRLVLDIGSSAVRLCELTNTKTGYQLTRYVQKEFDSDPSLDEEARKRNRIAATIEVMKQSKSRRRKTIFGVPGQSVFTRTRTLPPVPEYKVNQIVRYEIQQQIPFSLDQIAMDYQILDGTAITGYEVMMAAIKTDVVDKHIQVLDAVKRSVDVVDVCCIAAYNWLKHTGEFGDQGECVALIDMGASTTDIVIEREGRFRFTRPLNFGGNDITRAIASSFNVNFQDAERMKRERGFAPTGDAERDGKGGEVIGKALQRFVSEAMRSFAYFRSLPGGGQVHRVILCGGGACLRNIVPYLQTALGVEVRIAQPLAGLAIAPGAQQVNERPEQACVALGLSLRCCQPVPIEINLIPPRITELARQKEQAFYWALSLATLALIMASIVPMRAQQNELDLQEIQRLKRFISEYDPEMGQGIRIGEVLPQSRQKTALQEVQGKINGLKSNVDVLDQVRSGRTFWLDEFSIINDARPRGKGIWFATMQTMATKAQRPAGPGAPPALPPGLAAPGLANAPGAPAPGAAPAAGGQSVTSALASAVGGVTGTAPVAGGGKRGAADNATLFKGLKMDSWGQVARRGGGQTLVRKQGARSDAIDQVAVDIQNGIRVWGYAETDQIINDFVEGLRNGERTLSGGTRLVVSEVRIDNTSVQRVPWSILSNSPTDTAPNQGFGSNNADAEAAPLYSFEVDIVFERGLNVQPVAKRQGPAQPGAAALPGAGLPAAAGAPGLAPPGAGAPAPQLPLPANAPGAPPATPQPAAAS